MMPVEESDWERETKRHGQQRGQWHDDGDGESLRWHLSDPAST